ncbi:Putative beta-lactamase-inhibitor-like, PepSY-like [Chitinophaga jiangningensis]|uniref:Putative beta-lactamase-inhibitor-like, PepSY-like n=1 Tax=Chitinophaga jiangningensis TaxID=1419482 RepID=A0A1M7E0G2_9BACT|nr:PepSY-like domain-containing protein [Chitinophaga jiangningensis]SHL85255.1 Putative beta-lactamase-inhibitor-like, PepSY-like [Chitinophaga jiangningensis]
MKKFLIAIFAALTLTSANLYAVSYETTVNTKVKTAFDNAFANVSDVKWFTDDNKTFTAKFTLNNTRVNAYFDANGELLVTSRWIEAESLPLAVVNKLMKKYPGNSIQSIVEFESAGGTIYMIMLEGEKTWMKVRADENGNLTLKEKLQKA